LHGVEKILGFHILIVEGGKADIRNKGLTKAETTKENKQKEEVSKVKRRL
jgi:hypothetical protein